MRKKILFCFIAILTYHSSFSQEEAFEKNIKWLQKFSKNYFRSNPFIGSFSDFLKHLINDPDISGKIIQKKTDTSFYRFSGVYKNYNPFPFKPKRVEILFEETPFQYGDSLQIKDTLFIYQLTAYTDDNDNAIKEIKKEFEKIHRQNNRNFFDSKYDEEKDKEDIIVGVHHYFVALHWIAPLSVVWARLKTGGETALSIILRIKLSENESLLPASAFSR